MFPWQSLLAEMFQEAWPVFSPMAFDLAPEEMIRAPNDELGCVA
jgi:hypothetical protein